MSDEVAEKEKQTGEMSENNDGDLFWCETLIRMPLLMELHVHVGPSDHHAR